MMRLFVAFVLITSFILFGCSSDNTVPDLPTGTLVVLVTAPDETPESGASIVLTPGNHQQTTGNDGLATFENLPEGTYSGIIELSMSSDFYLEDAVYPFNDVLIVEDKITALNIQLSDGPEPIEEIPIDIDLLLADTYKKLKDDHMFGGYLQYWGDIGADIAYVSNIAPPTLLSLDRYDISPSNALIDNVWTAHYQVVRNVNIALDAIANSEYVSESGKEEHIILGEFRFLRALAYFNLIKLYGNPVLVTSTGIDAQLAQNRSGVKALIEQDLQYAEENLETYESSKTASKQAAQTLLGKFYLYLAGFPDLDTGKYSLAAQQFEKVLNMFSLEEDYSNIFDEGNESANSEIIFSIDFDSSQQNGGNLGVFWGPKGYALQDYLLLDSEFIQLYFSNENDLQNPISFPLNIDDDRFYNNIASFTIQGGLAVDATDFTDWRPLKYITDTSTVPQIGASGVDFPYLRYADVLLMMAEVENALNGPTAKAYDLVNQVIDRSDTSGISRLSDGLSQTDFLLELLKQRRKEFCFEGQNKDDLIRNGLLQNVIFNFNSRNPSLSKQYDTHEDIWPIPQSEINTNPNITQNPGY